MSIFYFGCLDDIGHDLKAYPLGTRPDQTPWRNVTPWGAEMDGTFAPPGEHKDKQGAAALIHKDGWSMLSWWDRTVDSRRASNSAIIAKGAHTFEEMLELLRRSFPSVSHRQTIAIYEAG